MQDSECIVRGGRIVFKLCFMACCLLAAGANTVQAAGDFVSLPAINLLILTNETFSSDDSCDCGSTDQANPCTGSSVSYTRDGETIGFEFNCDGGDCKCGQFANKWDFWVAPNTSGRDVTITAMTPTASGLDSTYRNGAQFGPTEMVNLNGFDGRSTSKFGVYDATWSLVPPVVVNPATLGRPETIMKAISEDEDANDAERIYLRYVETLTVLDEPPGDVFRPAYFGTNKVMYPVSSFDASVLSNVPSTATTPSWADAYSRIQSVHPQHYIPNQNLRQGYSARVNCRADQGYGGSVTLTFTTVLLKLTEEATGDDIAIKELTARGMTQAGIDLYAIHKEGIYNPAMPICGAWIPAGGMNQGNFAPILFANALLGQNWHIGINDTLNSSDGRLCFGETGFVQPASITSSGKGVPLFGSLKSLTLYGYNDGFHNCNVIKDDFLVDGGGDLCGSPTAYQKCCTHGSWLGAAMAIWLTPAVYDNFPPNAMHWLTYVDRSRENGVSVGTEFSSYSTSGDFTIHGFDSGYDSGMFYESWDTYRECSKTQSCEGM